MKSEDLLKRIINEDLEKPKLLDRHRLAFIALRDSIEHALNAGASAKRVWTKLRDENKISCSYPTFSRHVNSLILSKNEQNQISVKPSAKPMQKTAKQQDEKPQQVTPKEKLDTNIIKSFVYDPLILTKDDL
jgi:uncharacterized protein YdhG (YjbR/CyaY superfamily)